jgi:hypothetical protein
LLLLQDVHPKIVQERLGHARMLDTYSHVRPTIQHAAAEKLDQLIASARAQAAAEQARRATAAADSPPPAAAQTESAAGKERDWLQLGYKDAETAFSDCEGDEANDSDSRENRKWSHLDLNQGPPACEAGALTN